MKFRIVHETEGRIRVDFQNKTFTLEEADRIQYYFDNLEYVKKVKVYEYAAMAVFNFSGSREVLIEEIQRFSIYGNPVPEYYLNNSVRKLDEYYRNKIFGKILKRYSRKLLLPQALRGIFIWKRAAGFVAEALKSLWNGKVDVPVLDGSVVLGSLLRGDKSTAGSIMFLLDIGEILEEWTHKKSVAGLAGSMALNTPKVWLVKNNSEELVDSSVIETGDHIKVYKGNVIPFDGICVSGIALVNQASLTGEPLPVKKTEDISVYAGTVVEDGEIVFEVRETSGGSRYEKIVKLIEETEKLKSSVESKAEHMADKIVPYSLGATALVYLLSRNVTKALSVLMVDYSCALKLSTPITVLSAIKEAREYNINVKGGKFLEAVSKADTVVFDKTGTLTEAKPVLRTIIPFNDEPESELLRIAACLEEHFPHSMAKAVVSKADELGLVHEEMHSKPEYIIAHGIVSSVDDRRIIIGSYHFVFTDEKVKIPYGKKKLFNSLPNDVSKLYMAIDGKLAAVMLIEDPLREEAATVIEKLKELGIEKAVMMTGDSDSTAKSVAKKVGIDQYFSEVLPSEKAAFIEKEKAEGRTVIMVGDGINDSPALSASDCGIAISEGAELARDISDVVIETDSLYGLITLKEIADGMQNKLQRNFRRIMTINSTLIAGGITGRMQPSTTAFLHNSSTVAIGVGSMKNILPSNEETAKDLDKEIEI